MKRGRVFIVGAARTPIGSFMGILSSMSAPQLGAVAIKEVVRRANVRPESVQEVIMGMVLTGGAGQAPARQAAIFAGLPKKVPCTTVNKVCGSSLKAVMLATSQIQNGECDVVVAGGMESMSRAPFALLNGRAGLRLGHGELKDLLIHDGLWDVYNEFHMGTAADLCAKAYGITREQQDNYARESYLRTQRAIQEGWFKEEIVPVEIANKRGEVTQISEDEEPNRLQLEKLPTLKPAFSKEGTVTAANASSISDGAAAVVVASESLINEANLNPIAEILGYTSFACEPENYTIAPRGAIQALLERFRLKSGDIDLYEINEAFSVVALVNMQQLGLNYDRVNVHGGAVALGHPIGASGARLLTTLVYALKQRRLIQGIVSLCIGGGEAVAMIVKMVDRG